MIAATANPRRTLATIDAAALIAEADRMGKADQITVRDTPAGRLLVLPLGADAEVVADVAAEVAR